MYTGLISATIWTRADQRSSPAPARLPVGVGVVISRPIGEVVCFP